MAENNDARPSWLTEDCPAWCSADHAEQAYAGDRVHTSDTLDVPAIVRVTDCRGGKTWHHVDGTEVTVALSRRVGERETWLYIGTPDRQELELTLESAERLAEAIGAVLRRTR